MASVKQRLAKVANKQDVKELRPLLEAILDDLGAIRTTLAAGVVDVTAVATALDTLATKLNSDAGVTDTDYATDNAAGITASAPSALTLES